MILHIVWSCLHYECRQISDSVALGRSMSDRAILAKQSYTKPLYSVHLSINITLLIGWRLFLDRQRHLTL